MSINKRVDQRSVEEPPSGILLGSDKKQTTYAWDSWEKGPHSPVLFIWKS